MLEFDEIGENRTVIKVVGIGGVGISILESMINDATFGIDYIAVDTDVNKLIDSSASNKSLRCVNLEKETIKGVAGLLKGSNLVILVAGFDEETGISGIQDIADAARNLGTDLIVALVAIPITDSEKTRNYSDEDNTRSLNTKVDSLIVIPYVVADGLKADNTIFTNAIRGITALLTTTGLMSFDYHDVKAILPSESLVTIGVGEASGNDRALEAIQKALYPLSAGGVDIAHASGVLVNITGSSDMIMDEYNVINGYINSKGNADANVKIGVVRDDSLGKNIKVTVYLSNIYLHVPSKLQ